jgi:hypothetical protein
MEHRERREHPSLRASLGDDRNRSWCADDRRAGGRIKDVAVSVRAHTDLGMGFPR